MTHLRYRTFFPGISANDLFAFHSRVENLAKISPPFPPFVVVSAPDSAQEGDLQVFRLGWRAPLPGVTWRARITRLVPGRLLEDVQEAGPFRSWRHQHRFHAAPGGAVLEDAIAFRLLPTVAGEFLEWLLVRPAILGMFWWRHRRTGQLLNSPGKS